MPESTINCNTKLLQDRRQFSTVQKTKTKENEIDSVIVISDTPRGHLTNKPNSQMEIILIVLRAYHLFLAIMLKSFQVIGLIYLSKNLYLMVLFETILKCKFLNIKELREVINVFEMIVITHNHVIDYKKTHLHIK